MSPKMGRPPTGALGQYSSEMRQEISDMREAHSGWGPITILTELEKDSICFEKKVPSRSRIAAYLKQKSYTRKYEKPNELLQPKKKKAKQAHEIWEVDAQGKLVLPELGYQYQGCVQSFVCDELAWALLIQGQKITNLLFVEHF